MHLELYLVNGSFTCHPCFNMSYGNYQEISNVW